MIDIKRNITQARGRARRKILLDAARTLLEKHDLDQISLGKVAEQAGVPKASAYHFFASIYELYAELSGAIAQELRAAQDKPITTQVADWQQVMSICVDRAVHFFNSNRAASQLVLGPKSPSEIKHADRRRDQGIAQSLENHIGRFFILPDLPDRLLLIYYAVEIGDLMFCLSVIEHGRITPHMAREAKKATCAYLQLYIPAYLPPAASKKATGKKEQAH